MYSFKVQHFLIILSMYIYFIIIYSVFFKYILYNVM